MRLWLWLGALVGTSELSEAQDVARRVLGISTGELREEFTRIVAVRELSDGRVLVSDAGDRRVVVVDFKANTASTVGRQGRGPGEYTVPTLLHSLGPDSTLMGDLLSRRWLIFQSDRVAQTIPPDHPAIAATRGIVLGADWRGFVLASRFPAPRNGIRVMGNGDSSAVLLIAMATGRADTIAMTRVAPSTQEHQFDGTGRVVQSTMTIPRMSVGEEVLLFPDGWLAVARLAPYRVDWRAPDGRWVHGSPLAAPEVAFTAREKEAYLDRRARTSGTRPSGGAPGDWPSVVPPFQPQPLLPLPNGEVLVLRTPTVFRITATILSIAAGTLWLGWLFPSPSGCAELAGSGHTSSIQATMVYSTCVAICGGELVRSEADVYHLFDPFVYVASELNDVRMRPFSA